MRTEAINQENIKEYQGIIPSGYLLKVSEGALRAEGALFGGSVAGAVIWHDEKSDMVLDFIYVMPEYRRLGVGSMLMEQLSGQHLQFSYVASGDRVTLEPFFDALDVYTERSDCPVGSITLRDVKDGFETKKVSRAGIKGLTVDELTFQEKGVVTNWLKSDFGVDFDSYNDPKVPSVFYLKDNEIEAALVMGMGGEGLIDLDLAYCSPGNEVLFAGLFNKAVSELEKNFDDDVRIEMLLTTDEGAGLYTGLFGETAFSVPVMVSC
jgi:GNAT superfamily N-acetyltransferase